MGTIRILSLVAALMVCGAGNGYASMIGSTVTSQYYAYGGTYNDLGSPTTFVANGTVQQTFCGICDERFNLTVGANQITYDFRGTGGWSTSGPSLNAGGLFIANGNLLTFSGVTIAGVTIGASSSVPGFTSSRVTFNANNIAIELTGLSGTPAGTRVVLDVVTLTPEPTAWITTVLGLAGVGWLRFRKR